MGWFRNRSPRSGEIVLHAAGVDGQEHVIDVTRSEPDRIDQAEVALSIYATPTLTDRVGEALCVVRTQGPTIDNTGAVVPIRRHPHILTHRQVQELLDTAGRTGHLLDGGLEIEAVIDLRDGAITWQPENGEGLDLPHLSEVTENAFASLSEANLLGEWFVATAIERGPVDHQAGIRGVSAEATAVDLIEQRVI